MPITKDAKVGKNTVTLLQFGTGDILISSGYDHEDTRIKVMALSQHTPKPIEDWDKDIDIADENGERSTDALINPVLLYFDSVKSVDNVIHRLELVKADLLKEQSL